MLQQKPVISQIKLVAAITSLSEERRVGGWMVKVCAAAGQDKL